ncbi:hypothetical protein HanHA300_Chr11g0408911 [Helianthus annuus]|nr:hypothetical protein HanHA300_Chr11g0408911 [Helianthus annuus]KAJ0518030.1 hypothetical protein HanHA89_Chr11g0432621 [Helianthus annuus]KAJ0686049.1 hypothetical protein HanLR1_Chr11g0410151 [Helianthus annuus]KAJ0689898.1 hypothetical protein HanOQP8_Chr11g0411531 [Helianthus annuus]
MEFSRGQGFGLAMESLISYLADDDLFHPLLMLGQDQRIIGKFIRYIIDYVWNGLLILLIRLM